MTRKTKRECSEEYKAYRKDYYERNKDKYKQYYERKKAALKDSKPMESRSYNVVQVFDGDRLVGEHRSIVDFIKFYGLTISHSTARKMLMRKRDGWLPDGLVARSKTYEERALFDEEKEEKEETTTLADDLKHSMEERDKADDEYRAAPLFTEERRAKFERLCWLQQHCDALEYRIECSRRINSRHSH